MRPFIDKEVVCWSKLENETLLLNLVTGFYYTLDEIGGVIWEMLVDQKNPEEIAAKIVDEYDVTAEAAVQDLKELLNMLQSEGVLTFK